MEWFRTVFGQQTFSLVQCTRLNGMLFFSAISIYCLCAYIHILNHVFPCMFGLFLQGHVCPCPDWRSLAITLGLEEFAHQPLWYVALIQAQPPLSVCVDTFFKIDLLQIKNHERHYGTKHVCILSRTGSLALRVFIGTMMVEEKWCWMTEVVSWLGEVRIPMKVLQQKCSMQILYMSLWLCNPRGSMLWPAMLFSVQPGTETPTPSAPLDLSELEAASRKLLISRGHLYGRTWRNRLYHDSVSCKML